MGEWAIGWTAIPRLFVDIWPPKAYTFMLLGPFGRRDYQTVDDINPALPIIIRILP